MAKASKPTPGQPLQIEQVAVSALIPYARNSRTHSDEQVAQIAASIREFGFTNPVLIDADSGIVAGHGRVMAARKLGLAEVPCLRLGHLSDTQKRAYIIADNKLALNSGWDYEALELELADLKSLDFDVSLIDFDVSDPIGQQANQTVERPEPNTNTTEIGGAVDDVGKKERMSFQVVLDLTKKQYDQVNEYRKTYGVTAEEIIMGAIEDES